MLLQMQAFFLVADDVMDYSVTRRGQPCWYKKVRELLLLIVITISIMQNRLHEYELSFLSVVFGFSFSILLPTCILSFLTSVCIRLHQHTLLNCAHRCLNQPIVVNSVQLLRMTLQ